MKPQNIDFQDLVRESNCIHLCLVDSIKDGRIATVDVLRTLKGEATARLDFRIGEGEASSFGILAKRFYLLCLNRASDDAEYWIAGFGRGVLPYFTCGKGAFVEVFPSVKHLPARPVKPVAEIVQHLPSRTGIASILRFEDVARAIAALRPGRPGNRLA